MATQLKRKGIFLLGVLVGAALSVSAGIVDMERTPQAPDVIIYGPIPSDITPTLKYDYVPIHAENDHVFT